MTLSKYQECIKRLSEAGAGAPAGRLYHFCFGDKDGVSVSDISDSNGIVRTIRANAKADPGGIRHRHRRPVILEVLNIIEAAKASAA